jgi:hypothetical protein
VSLGVSFYTFHFAQEAQKAAQRAYLGIHMKDAKIKPAEGEPHKLVVNTNVVLTNVGNTPATITNITQDIFAIEGDNKWDVFGGSMQLGPRDDRVGPKSESPPFSFETTFAEKDLTNRGVGYRAKVSWKDAFGKADDTDICLFLSDVDLPINEARTLSGEACPVGLTRSVDYKAGEKRQLKY